MKLVIAWSWIRRKRSEKVGENEMGYGWDLHLCRVMIFPFLSLCRPARAVLCIDGSKLSCFFVFVSYILVLCQKVKATHLIQPAVKKIVRPNSSVYNQIYEIFEFSEAEVKLSVFSHKIIYLLYTCTLIKYIENFYLTKSNCLLTNIL